MDHFFRAKDNRIVLWQMPNLPIIGWVVFLCASKLTEGSAHTVLSVVSTAFLVIWALLEVFGGVNYFRRTLGVVVLAYTLFRIIF